MTTQQARPTLAGGRRRSWRRLSDPVIYRTLHLAAILGCLLGVMLFAQFEAGRARTSDTASVTVWADTLSPGLEALFDQSELTARDLLPLIDRHQDASLDPEIRRSALGEINERMVESGLSGLILMGQAGQMVDAIGRTPAHIPPEQASELSNGERISLQRIDGPAGRFVIFRTRLTTTSGANLVLVLPLAHIHEILERATAPSVLLNRDGELIAAGRGVSSSVSPDDLELLELVRQVLAGTDDTARRLDQLDSMLSSQRSARAMTDISQGQAHVLVFRAYKGPMSAIYSFRSDLLYLAGPSLVGILLVLSLIQNEWRRQDRLDRDRGNMTARARIAGEIMSAGIIDWSVREGTLSYSEGWARMFGYEQSPQHEEVFDWVNRIHPDDRISARNHYEGLQDGTLGDLEHTIRVRKATGDYIHVRERARVHEDSANDERFVVLVQTEAVATGEPEMAYSEA